MFRPLLLAGMVVGALGGAASAADIGGPPASSDYVVPTPYYDWTGLYVGGNVGGAWEYHNGATTTDLVSGKSFAEPIHDRFWGVAGGAQLGFNWFVLPSYLVGTEGDFTALTNRHSNSLTDSTGTATQAEHPEMLSTIRLRVGLTADRFVWYGTGGVAWVDDRFTRTQVSGAANSATAGTVETVNYTGIGYAVGTGLEYAMMSHVTARVEFLYVGLGTETYTFPLAHRTTSATFDSIGLVRFGLNYRFGGGDAQVPIRARD